MHPSDLNVVLVVSNPVRWDSRIKRFLETYARLKEQGCTIWVVETVSGERPFEIIDALNPRHIGFRFHHEVWIKEAMINAAVRRFPQDWKYMAWVDADVSFVRDDWVMETLHALQHYAVVQPFSHALDLDPGNRPLENVKLGFAHCYNLGHKIGEKYSPYHFPGYAWAWRRDAWDFVGGMIDMALCGSGDDHMAKGLVGKADLSLPKGLHPNYRHMVKKWEETAEQHIRRNIGHVPGMVLHYFHGYKADRKYNDRWSIITDNQFDPYHHVTRDWQGLPYIRPEHIEIRDQLRRYFRERNEDARGQRFGEKW